MKKIFLILLCLIPMYVLAQDQYPYQLPEYTTVSSDSTDVLYIDDSGIDKHIEMPTLLAPIGDSAAALRNELDTAKANIRGEITGAAGWTKTGTRVSLTNTDDSLSIGTAIPLRKFWVYGHAGSSGNLYTDTIYLSGNGSGSGWATGTGDNLKLGDNNNSTGVALSTLMTGGGAFGLGNLGGTYFYYTLNPTYNWNFGAIAPTNSKFKVTGTFNVTDDATFDDYIRLGAYSYLYPQNIGALSTIRLGTDASTGFWDFDINSNDAMSILNGDDVGINFSRTDLSFSARTSVGGAVGYFYFDGDSVRINPANGVDYVLGTGGSGSGTGTIDTTGLPEAGQLPVFTAANKIGGYDELTWQTGTGSLYVGDASAKSQIDGSYLSVFISNVEKTTLSPGLAASANTYLFGTTNSRTTGIHTRFIDNTQDLMYLYRDSAVIYQDLHLRDSTYLDLFAGDPNVWLTLTSTGAIDTAATENAGFMLTLSPFPSVKDYMKNTLLIGKYQELEWLYVDKGVIKKTFDFKSLRPWQQMNALQGGLERSYRWILELTEKNETLESELRKTQTELDELRGSLNDRISLMEQALIKRLAE